MQEGNHFFIFCTTKSPRLEEKIKIIIKKSNVIFIPVLEKLESADFVNPKNKKCWPYCFICYFFSDNCK